MKYIPNSASRFVHRQGLKISAASPTILVVAGVVGLGATAVMAAKASRRAEPVIEYHEKSRIQIAETALSRESERGQVLSLYRDTGLQLSRVYGPTIVVGTVSAASVLYGHKILRGRHVASLMAYSGLQEQFLAYRGRVANTLGEQAERDIYGGAHGEYIEDPDHKGEYKLSPVFSNDGEELFFRPWLREGNPNWSLNPDKSLMFLTGIQNYHNVLLGIRGHIFLNEVLEALGMPKVPEGQVAGWLYDGTGDQHISLGFMTNNDPQTVAYREGRTPDVQLDFNIDGNIYEMMLKRNQKRL